MAAVQVQNGYKYYGSKSKPLIVLNNLNMIVEPGSIYGLLGSSGCGKTTLLSCIVGHRRLNGGDVRVLGQKPGVPGSGLSSRIGYMPQEIALVGHMSVKESVYFFGRIYGMTSEKIEEKFESLEKLLELPPSSQLINNCSGGQQRRVSFACALIHDPELLILDEPTVGMDPMLREKVWQFVVATTRQSKTAVIITTHYIEEARQANCIGLMRNGVLLDEDTPENIMLRYEVNSIEDAFLILCRKQGENLPPTTQTLIHGGQQAIDDSTPQTDVQSTSSHSISCMLTIKALLAKNFIKTARNPVMACYVILLPIVLLFCFYTGIGKTVRGLKLGIVNSESFCEDLNMTSVLAENDTCYFNNISCRFIRTISSTDYLKPILYHDLEAAHRDAKKSIIAGYIEIPYNFSSAMQTRIEEGRYADDYSVEHSIMKTHLDMAAGQSIYYTILKLREHYRTFMKDIMMDCDFPIHLASTAINFNEPIYGSEEGDFQQFMAPGIVLGMIFFLNTLVSASIFVEERADGLWDRTLIAGVSTTQLLWSQLFTHMIVMAIQNVEVLLLVAFAFNGYNHGSTLALVVLLFATSVGGMFFGLLLSIVCKTHTNTSFAVAGSFYILIVTCGIMWPLEGVPTFLKQIFIFTPLTLPTTSARNIIDKGMAITCSAVYKGYLAIAVWIIIFYVLCVIGLRRKS